MGLADLNDFANCPMSHGAHSKLLHPKLLPKLLEHSLRTVVIVGGGFCGTVLAANLLKRLSKRPTRIMTRIILIERKAEIGRGVAYAEHRYPYLLNVSADKMSANPDDPLEFLQFARQQRPSADAAECLPRAWYGKYLQSVLLDAEQTAKNHIVLTRVTGEAIRVSPARTEKNYSVELDDGRVIDADDVVLALGNPPPASLPGATELQGHQAYVENPWALSRVFNSQHRVLIVGTGLTMTDALLNLTDDEQQMPMVHAISRRGQLPLEQGSRDQSALPINIEMRLNSLLWAANSTRKLLAATRQLGSEFERDGIDWRALISGIRAIAPRLWQRLPLLERQRFIRHVQCYWDVCRHRVPEHVGEHIKYVQQAGRLQVNAGRIVSMEAAGRQIRVHWRPRGRSEIQRLQVDAVINATGPNYNITQSHDPLLKNLCADGLTVAGSIGSGLRTGSHCAVINHQGEISNHLFYLGPMLRTAYWESTAAAELSAHATALANVLAGERN